MIVTCNECGKSYDDVYRLTYCPHTYFEMNTVVCSNGKDLGVAHSVEELREMLNNENRLPVPSSR